MGEYSWLQIFPFSTLKIFWPTEFLLKSQLLDLWEFPCTLLVAFLLLLFIILSLSLRFATLIGVFLGVVLFQLILFETLFSSSSYLFPLPG